MADFYSPIGRLLPIPSNLSLAQFMLDAQYKIRPTRLNTPCMVDDKSGKQISFEELGDLSYGLANSLSSRYHLREDDTIMLISPNTIYYPIAVWAVHKLGGIVTFSNPQFSIDEVVHQLSVANVTFMIVHHASYAIACSAASLVGLSHDRIILLDQEPIRSVGVGAPNVPDLAAEGINIKRTFHERTLEAGEGKSKIAMLCWSSGTTGKPKAVAISHYGIIANIIQMSAHNHVGSDVGYGASQAYRPGDVALGVLPFFHVAGLVISLHLVLYCAMTLVVVQKYDFHEMLNSLVRHRISHLFLVPPQAIDLCKHAPVKSFSLPMIKYLMIGAAPVSREVQERLFELFPAAQIGQAYGLTEMTTTLAMVSAVQKRGPLGSGGRLLPGVQAKVIKSDGTIAGYGEPGELIVRGPSIALGYFRDEKATKETFRDGWVHTGDKVVITNDREIYVLDRLKEMIKVKGFQVAPAEIEGCILGHPDVLDACVVGVLHDYYGEVPLAFVVLSPEAAVRIRHDYHAAAIIKCGIAKYVADRKIGYKQLKGGIEFIDSIPKNGSGKILRRVLREKARQQLTKRRPFVLDETVSAKL